MNGNTQDHPEIYKVWASFPGSLSMITLSTDEAVLIRSILTALRGIKVRDIDKALVILSKAGGESSIASPDQLQD